MGTIRQLDRVGVRWHLGACCRCHRRGNCSLALTRATVRYLLQRSTPSTPSDGENQPSLSKPLLIALELLVVADVLQTVVLEPTLYNVVALALLLLVRTFLSWSMRVEIDGRWPWQSKCRCETKSRKPGVTEFFTTFSRADASVFRRCKRTPVALSGPQV